MPLPWIKMWLESLDDPKLTRLSLAERGAWWGILKLAGKCDAGGKILSGSVGLDMDEIADALHIKTGDDRQALESMVTKMVGERGSLKWNESNALTVIHWEERQRIPPSARPEAIAERVRLYRERRKKTEEPEELAPSPTPGRIRGKVSRDSKEATGLSQDFSRDSKEATRQILPEMSQDDEVLAIWSGVKNFPLTASEDSNAATRFLAELKAEFPDVDILEESKSWAAGKLSEPLAERSMPFKQLRTWMKRARQFQEGEIQKPRRETKKSGKKIHKLCPSCDYKALTDEDYCPICLEMGKDTPLVKDYQAGIYGHMVRR